MKRLDEITLRRMLRESRENAARERLDLRAACKKALDAARKAEKEAERVRGELAEAKERAARVFHQHETDLLLRDAENTRQSERLAVVERLIAAVAQEHTDETVQEANRVREIFGAAAAANVSACLCRICKAVRERPPASDSTAFRQPLRSGALVLPGIDEAVPGPGPGTAGAIGEAVPAGQNAGE